MNYGRVILGGLVAGLVLNIGEFVLNGVILHTAMVEWAQSPQLPYGTCPFIHGSGDRSHVFAGNRNGLAVCPHPSANGTGT